jgi:hypothetical protein
MSLIRETRGCLLDLAINYYHVKPHFRVQISSRNKPIYNSNLIDNMHQAYILNERRLYIKELSISFE